MEGRNGLVGKVGVGWWEWVGREGRSGLVVKVGVGR